MRTPIKYIYSSHDMIMHMIAGITVGIIFGIAIALAVAATPPYDANIEYDLTQCDWLVKDLKDGPPVQDFKEAVKTPGGNWCIKEWGE